MKAPFFRTLWIIILSVILTAWIGFLAIIKNLQGTTSRLWVDSTLRRWTDRILNLVQVHTTIVNPHQVEPQAGRATIIMCNHSSLYDIPLSFKAFPHTSIRMLAKKELSKIPIMNKGMAASEFLFINRKDLSQAKQALADMRRLLESGIVMWVAPEGTRSVDGKLQAFKKGTFITAIQTKASIIPIGIRGASNILPAHTLRFNLGQKAEIHIGEPIDASQYTLENKEALIATVHASMKKLLGET